MAIETIYPYRTVELTVSASESIAMSNYGGGKAKIYYLLTPVNAPDVFKFQQTLENSSVTLGPFSSNTVVKIDSGRSKVFYDIGSSPDTSIGDADMLGGQSPAYYTNASNMNAGTLPDARLSNNIPQKSASNTFAGNIIIENNSSGIVFKETDTTTQSLINQDGGTCYFQVSTSSYTGGGNLYFAGASNADISTFRVRNASAWKDIWHAGHNPSLADGNTITGTFTTTDGKTITVTNGIITAIAGP